MVPRNQEVNLVKCILSNIKLRMKKKKQKYDAMFKFKYI